MRMVTLESGFSRLRVDAVVDDRDPVAQVNREGVALIFGRRHRRIRGIERTELHGVLGAQAPHGLDILDRIFRIEIEVLALGRIIIFEIGHVVGLRPHVLEEEVLSPSRIHRHHVGTEALLGEASRAVSCPIGPAQTRDHWRITVVERLVVGTVDRHV